LRKERRKTLRHLIQQDVQRGVESNAFWKHIEGNKSHKIDWDNFLIIDKESHWKKRKIKEALYINALNPQDI
jgi:predicted nucleotidyltransferase